MAEKTRKFKTEVQHLLDLMIHSLYSNKDIFLRELVANAADAIDKARFAALTDSTLNREWQIKIEQNKDAKTLTISDNGIGMTADEVVENIGTIAKSGTKAFLKQLEESQTPLNEMPELIGQFGVGFYSAFMVAEEVELISKRAGSNEPAVCWTSKGQENYTLEEATRDDQGTTIILHLKTDAELYLEPWKVTEIVHRYSDFIEYPIMLPTVKKNDDNTETIEEKILNSQKAIWLRNASEITDEEHQSFYAHLSHGGKLLKPLHIAAEGTSEFKALLYIPEKLPFNLFMPDLQKKGLQLYVRRVFITDECKDLVPDYLRFIKGVVDSSDLPLNVSREILQENPQIMKIQKAIVAKVLSELKKLQEKEPEKYLLFYQECGKILKEGIHTDFQNQDKIKELAMYESMNSEAGKLISLREYVAAMPSSQQDIYYITAENRTTALASPALEIYRSKGYDVLLMTDPIDEWVMQSMFQYDKKHFKSVAKGELELDADSKKELENMVEAAAETHKSLVEYLAKELENNVKEVRFSGRLTESACCLVADEQGLSAHMERFFKAMNQEIPAGKRILELNPKHPLVEAMQKLYDQDPQSAQLKEYAGLLYDQALLTEGSQIADPGLFAKRIADLMVAGLKN